MALPFLPVLLLTDALVYLLLALAVALAVRSVRHAHLRAPWRRLLSSRVGVAALVVLLVYGAVGLLDTLHLRLRAAPAATPSSAVPQHYAPEVISVLDWLLSDLRRRQEKTYSAPFATRLYVKEAIEQPDGRVVRDYPRLRQVATGLETPGQVRRDIAKRAARGMAGGVLAWALAVLAVAAWLGRRRGRQPAAGLTAGLRYLWRGDSWLPWKTLLATLGLVLLVGCTVAALAAGYHVLGTDKVGEDVFYQTLKSVRTGLLIGTLTTLVMLPAAILLGIAAGYFRGWVDDVVQYLYTTLNSIPGVLLIAASVLMLQVYLGNHAERFDSLVERADLRLLCLCLILGVTSWTGLCRLLRGEALKLREADYVQAAIALGVGHGRILVRHILPNLMHIVLITVALDFSALVLAEAVLSYVNIGVDPTTHSWGNMINRARMELAREPVVWWSLGAALGSMFTLVLAANLFADALRDAFDPRLQGGQR